MGDSGAAIFLTSADNPLGNDRVRHFDNVTRIDYIMTMKGVRVAELKSKLSEHLRKVRAGRTVTVLDRSTPIARIVPYEDQPSTLAVRSPVAGAPALKDIRLPPPLRLPRDLDVVEFLLKERQGER